MTDLKLRPCPFCGGTAEIGTASVYCTNDECGAQIWATPYSAEGIPAAIEAWNKRSYSHLSSTLKQLREEKGVTRGWLAKIVGLPISSIEEFELGTRKPSRQTAVKLAAYFGVSVGYLEDIW